MSDVFNPRQLRVRGGSPAAAGRTSPHGGGGSASLAPPEADRRRYTDTSGFPPPVTQPIDTEIS